MLQIHNKLVRDLIPERLLKKGLAYHTRILNEEEYKTALLDKLKEETEELSEATSANPVDRKAVLEEIADCIEVIRAIQKHCDDSAKITLPTYREIEKAMTAFKIEWHEVTACREIKLAERGGFSKRILLVSVS